MTLRAVLTVLILGLGVVACGPGARASAIATAIATPTATTSPAVTPTSVPTPLPTATPAPPTATPIPTVSPAAACVVEPQTGVLPTDRLVDVEVLGLPGRDIVRFSFEEGSLTPAGQPTGTLAVATPPFTEAESGEPIDLRGEHALEVVFKGMSLQNDVGQPTYVGDREIAVTDPSRSLRQAVVFDESEGQMGWYLGYDGTSCVTLTREGNDILLAIESGPRR